jgi:K+-sensing histidine kinase KdpD
MMRNRLWIGYAWAAGAALSCTLAGLAMQPRFAVVNIAMVYLLAVVVIALRFSRGTAIVGWCCAWPRSTSCSSRRADRSASRPA